MGGVEFFESKVRPLLVRHCYECHSEEHQEQQGGLLLDRASGWLGGGDTGKAVIPGEADASLLVRAVRYDDSDLQMPPDGKLSDEEIKVLEQWISGGAIGPAEDMGDTEFSQLGDQEVLFDRAKEHWAFRPPRDTVPPVASNKKWNESTIDRFVFAKLKDHGITPSPIADTRTLCRRLHFDLIGLPPSSAQITEFQAAFEQNADSAIADTITRLMQDPCYGQHMSRMWLDVVRYADTDSTYRPDTKTPHYFPFAFTYRDYVVDSFNADKPYDRFLVEQFAADELGYGDGDREIAALGFFGVGPYANRSQAESLDDWIDLTTRGLMGLTVACARCHDHKYEPVPTVDYYSLRGVFASLDRIHPLDEEKQPAVDGYRASEEETADYKKQLAKIMKQIDAAGGKKAKGNNRSIAEKIRETDLAQLWAFHPGAPAHAMVVRDKQSRPRSFVFVRGDGASRGEPAPSRFLKILDSEQEVFGEEASLRMQLAQRIADPDNPLTARVIVNRVWGSLMGAYLVATPSDFGLQGTAPTHPELLDHLAIDFVEHGWSIKYLVRQIVSSQTYLQRSRHRDDAAAEDRENHLLWRANRKRLSIEELRDSLLQVAQQLDSTVGGRPGPLWEGDYTRRRSIYGFINRFNLDPTLGAFDFPSPMQSQSRRGESVVAPQALFTMNAGFVVDQAKAVTQTKRFLDCATDAERISCLFDVVLQRQPAENEITKVERLLEFQARFTDKPSRFDESPWPMVVQALMMSNEFQYFD
ncbi:Planctomycete cytochrome C [Stieleria varia]|uniref:Planctomycete cytochrome C n=2 Tax=Stieleria varia TaxID=2528005 RepID=A0A5C6B342_9BACT|nr:Planctomycete cytochrome C [Stieleria varia]